MTQEVGRRLVDGEWVTNIADESGGGGSVTAADVDSESAGNGEVLTADGAGGASWEAGGGSQPGVAIVRGPFPFAYNTPGLTAGVSVYDLADGEALLDAWIIATVGWDGTTPLADIGPFASAGDGGWFFNLDSAAVDLTVASGAAIGVFYPPKLNQLSQALPGAGAGTALISDGAQTVKLVVSQDGKRGGADPGASLGTAKLWIVTATPDALP